MLIVRTLSLSKLGRVGFIRGLLFDAAAPNSIILAAGKQELFLVSTSDKTISRTVYVSREPYDFDKALWALNLVKGYRDVQCLVDIGANVGTICIPAVKRGLVETAIAFEPEPRNFLLLSMNLALNGVSDKIRVVNSALGAQDGATVDFELSPDNFGDHRIRPAMLGVSQQLDTRQVINVKTQMLETALMGADVDKSLLFIDTQGYEAQVLMGATSILRKRPPMVIEFWPFGLDRQNGFEALKSALVMAGYSEFTVIAPPYTTRLVTADNLDELYLTFIKDDNFTDILIV